MGTSVVRAVAVVAAAAAAAERTRARVSLGDIEPNNRLLSTHDDDDHVAASYMNW